MYPDFAESFEKKFQVTFDLRECEMSDQKPTRKRQLRAKSSFIKRSNKSLNRTNSNNTAVTVNSNSIAIENLNNSLSNGAQLSSLNAHGNGN